MTTLTASRRMPLRAAAICGLLAPVTVSIGWIGGALAQPDAYRSADDDLSDLGAQTANMAAACGFRRSSLCPSRRPWAFSSAASATARRYALRASPCSSGSGS